MAWAGTTTELSPHQLVSGTFKMISTNFLNSTVESTNADLSQIPGGLKLTTGTDVVRLPFHKPDGKMVIYGYINGAGSTTVFPAIALRLPESSDGLAWRSPVHAGTSTENTGWHVIRSTSATIGSSGREAFVTGPFETAKYGLNFFGTSSASIDVNQSYLEVMFLDTASSDADASVLLASATNICSTRAAAHSIIAFELP